MEACKDHISLLPDHLLSSILSGLPISQAAQTSVLSKRWEHLWKSAPSISFNRVESKISPPGVAHLPKFKRIARDVDCVFSSHTERVFACELVYYKKNLMSDVERWIEQLSSRRIQDLVLICRRDHYDIQPFEEEEEGKELRVLKSARPFAGCLELRTLRLESVRLTDQALADIICYCVALEHLVLCECDGINQIRIRSTALKGLELMKLFEVEEIDIKARSLDTFSMNGFYDAHATSDMINNVIQNSPYLERMILHECILRNLQIHASNLKLLDLRTLRIEENIDIHAPRLASLRMGDVSCKGCFDIATPSLQSLSTHVVEVYKDGHLNLYACQSNADLLARCAHLFGKFPPEAVGGEASTPFDSLNKLSIDLDLNNPRDAIVLAYLLKICLHLQELIVQVEGGRHGKNEENFTSPLFYRDQRCEEESPYWEGQDVFSYTTHHLKTVKLSGFTGKLLEFDFARFVIKRAVALQSMIVECRKDLSKDGKKATRVLKSLPKASWNARIIIKHE